MIIRSQKPHRIPRNRVPSLAILFVVLLVFCPNFARADLIPYTSRSAFDTAAISPVSVLDFESFPIANVNAGNSLGGVTFSYSLGSVSLKVVNSLSTTSGTKSLGTDDLDRLQDGDNIDLSFAARSGFGLYVVSSDVLLSGDVGLQVNGTEALLNTSASPISLGGGRTAWFLGVQSDDGTSFSTAKLTTYGGGGAFNYNLDDFVSVSPVPEPSSAWLLGFVAVAGCRHRNRKEHLSDSTC